MACYACPVGIFESNTLFSALFVSLCHCSERTILLLAESIHIIMCHFTFHRSFAGVVNVNALIAVDEMLNLLIPVQNTARVLAYHLWIGISVIVSQLS